MAGTENRVRRYDLDWLRVLVFGLLIIFHISIGFDEIGFLVYGYGNNQLGGTWLSLFILFTHGWRLPLLFLIAGMGTCFAFGSRTMREFLNERSFRLLVPLIFSMVFVLIFPRYVQFLNSSGMEISFIEYVKGWFGKLGFISHPQHLWFLVNLFIYSLVCAPIFARIQRDPESGIGGLVKWCFKLKNGIGLLLLIPLPLVVVEFVIRPVLPGEVGLGYEFFWYLILFITGYLCIIAREQFWESLEKIRVSSIVLGCALMLSYIVILVTVGIEGSGDIWGGEAIRSQYIFEGGWMLAGFGFWEVPMGHLVSIIHSLNAWAWCMVCFSWGAKYLNKPSKLLTYLNQGVYPFYIVHLPFTLVALYYLKDVELYWIFKFIIITGITGIGCWLVFEIAKRNKILRMAFGIN